MAYFNLVLFPGCHTGLRRKPALLALSLLLVVIFRLPLPVPKTQTHTPSWGEVGIYNVPIKHCLVYLFINGTFLFLHCFVIAPCLFRKLLPPPNPPDTL